MADGIRLIVGLGNPGAKYAETRHNAGAWFIHMIAQNLDAPLRNQTRFHGQTSIVRDANDRELHLLVPSTFMNLSGQAVAALSRYYDIPANAILIAHDEIDLPTGDIRLKFDGGHGGHNGLRDIISHLKTNSFHRLRIGVDHPGHKDDVTDYVLSNPSKTARKQIDTSLGMAETLIPDLLSGNFQQAAQALHTKEK